MDDRTILLVEDNPDDALLIRRALRKGGIHGRVEVARDGAEALDQLFATGDVPRLVLLDLKLPKVDGWEVLRHLRADERTADLPVVVFVSEEDGSPLEEVPGADYRISKGVDYEAFLRAVRKLRSLVNEIGSLTARERRALAGFVLSAETGPDAPS